MRVFGKQISKYQFSDPLCNKYLKIGTNSYFPSEDGPSRVFPSKLVKKGKVMGFLLLKKSQKIDFPLCEKIQYWY